MKLYSKNRNGNKIILTILGIKFKYKIKTANFLNNLFQEWQTDFHPLLLEQKLRTILKCNTALKEENKEIFLIYISTLIENNKISEASETLKTYISHYGYEFISSYPLISNLLYDEGCTNTEIQKCAQIWKTLENNRTNLSLENYLQNKKIAIIGHSPNLIGTKKGKKIDQADIVIRFNNYTTKNYEQDYGNKTNIWVCCQAGDIINRSLDEISKLNYILYNIDLKHTKLHPKFCDIIYQNLSAQIPISYIGDEYKKQLKQYGIIYPSSGLSALYHLNCICKISKQDIFGFSFLENATNYYEHYFQKRSFLKIKKFTQNAHHNFELENTILQNIFGE